MHKSLATLTLTELRDRREKAAARLKLSLEPRARGQVLAELREITTALLKAEAAATKAAKSALARARRKPPAGGPDLLSAAA